MININKEGSSFKKSRKVMICGLNQLGLCEDKGFDHPVDVPWDNGGELNIHFYNLFVFLFRL